MQQCDMFLPKGKHLAAENGKQRVCTTKKTHKLEYVCITSVCVCISITVSKDEFFTEKKVK